MAWAANEVNNTQQNISATIDGEEHNKLDLEHFKDGASEYFGVSDETAEVIFGRQIAEESPSSPGMDGELSMESFKDSIESAKELKNIREGLDVNGFDKTAAMMLTGDTDGKMELENVEILKEKGYLKESEDGKLVGTDEGKKFLEYAGTKGDLLTSDKHMIEHLVDYESQNISEEDRSTLEAIAIEDKPELKEEASGILF